MMMQQHAKNVVLPKGMLYLERYAVILQIVFPMEVVLVGSVMRNVISVHLMGPATTKKTLD